MKFNLRFLVLLPIIFFFLPAFAFYVPAVHKSYTYYYILVNIIAYLVLIVDRKYILKKLRLLCKYTPFTYFVAFIFLACINSFFLVFIGYTSIKQTFFSIIMQIFLCIIPNFIFFLCIIGRFITFKNFIRIFLFLYWLNLIMGIFAYIGRAFDINIINNIFDFLANAKLIRGSGYNAESYFTYSKRISGLFEEPGFLGSFIFFFLPFIYTFSNTNFSIYKNKSFNKIFKLTVIPLAWLNICMTRSPITLIFASIITVIYYYKNIIHFVHKYFIQTVICICFIVFLLSNVNYTDTYMMRIINVLTKIKSFEGFILIEQSLATRVVGYINTFCIFLQHPFTGVGIGNIPQYVYKQYLNSPVPLTNEIIILSKLRILEGRPPHILSGFIYSMLAEYGIFICVFFLYSYYLIIKKVSYYTHIFIANPFYYCVLKSLKYSLICLSMEFIYDLYIVSPYLHLVIALSLLMILYCQLSLKGIKNG